MKDIINKNIIIQAYLNEYGLDNCLEDILINEEITGLKSINELENMLLIHDSKTTQKINNIKKKYMTYIIDKYYDGAFDKVYDELNIKDQDIDLGESNAIKKLNIDLIKNVL